MTFGTRLKEIRISKSMTQEEFAKKIKLSKSNISKYEAGSVEPNLETLAEISLLFDVSVDYLLGLPNKPTAEIQINSYERTLLKEIRTLNESDKLDVLAYIKFKKSQQQNIRLAAEDSGSGEAVINKKPHLT